ncbi:MAG: LPXTG cell wall anchor domain-containing protein [Youngiibacter sp.]|nr:LPXTG cell wall anchor domain-containing protein [Youngiibacter sp.]
MKMKMLILKMKKLIQDEEEGSLPQTGGIPSELLYAIGMMAMAGGVMLMRKKEQR